MRGMEKGEALALLRWYGEAGVDTTVGEAPADFRASVAAPPQPRERTTPIMPARVVRPLPPPVTASQLSQTAQGLAEAAPDLAALKEAVAGFEGCALKKTAMNLVFADGNPESDLMLIGEAPGSEEDRQGLPFVGPSGQLLDRMLQAIGRDRQSAYIANILPWRPPGNRKPTAEETEACLPFVRRHIELVGPRILVFLGGTAANALVGTTDGITRLRGKWLEYSAKNGTIWAMPTFHPAYLLRSPALKQKSWQDFLAVRTRLEKRG
jgi:DNA polymerase